LDRLLLIFFACLFVRYNPTIAQRGQPRKYDGDALESAINVQVRNYWAHFARLVAFWPVPVHGETRQPVNKQKNQTATNDDANRHRVRHENTIIKYMKMQERRNSDSLPLDWKVIRPPGRQRHGLVSADAKKKGNKRHHLTQKRVNRKFRKKSMQYAVNSSKIERGVDS
jgi:hypothetical protein